MVYFPRDCSSTFSRKTYANILSFYLELIEKDECMTAPQIGLELEVDAETIRRFISAIEKLSELLSDEGSMKYYGKLYEEILLHTKFAPNTERYMKQQEIIQRRNRRKELIIKVKQKTKEYNQKKNYQK